MNYELQQDLQEAKDYEESRALVKAIEKNKNSHAFLLGCIASNDLLTIETYYTSSFKHLLMNDTHFLETALSNQRWNIAQFFFQRGTPLNKKDKDSHTLLHCIIKKTNKWEEEDFINAESIIEKPIGWLLERQADPTITNDEKQTPLHLSALCGFYTIAHLLLEAQQKLKTIQEELLSPTDYVNLQDHEGNTPLHLIFYGRYNSRARKDHTIPFINLLLKHGALVTIKNKRARL